MGGAENKPEGVGGRIGLHKAKVCLSSHLRAHVCWWRWYAVYPAKWILPSISFSSEVGTCPLSSFWAWYWEIPIRKRCFAVVSTLLSKYCCCPWITTLARQVPTMCVMFLGKDAQKSNTIITRPREEAVLPCLGNHTPRDLCQILAKYISQWLGTNFPFHLQQIETKYH